MAISDLRFCLPLTCSTALAAAGCGSLVRVDPPDAAPADAGADTAEVPLHCGNHAPDPGEDCDGTPGCPVTCHVAPVPGTVAVRFRGAVSLVHDPEGVFGGVLQLEAPLWGRVVYPTSLPDDNPDPSTGYYPYTNAGARDSRGIWMTVGLWSFRPDRGTGYVAVQDNLDGVDAFAAQVGNLAVTPPAAGLQHIVLDLRDPGQTAVTADALPRTQLAGPAAWAMRRVYVQGSTPGGVTWQIEAVIDELSLEAAP